MYSNHINNANGVVSSLTVAAMAWGNDNVWDNHRGIMCTICGMCQAKSGYQIIFSCGTGIRSYLMHGIKATDIDMTQQIEEHDREHDLAVGAVQDEVHAEEVEDIVVDVDIDSIIVHEDGEEDN